MINIYSKKQRWKAFLFITALIIIGLSMAYTNILVDNIAKEEERKVRLWAKTVTEKAELVRFANELFVKIKKDERKKGELWAKGVKYLVSAESSGDIISFLLDLVTSNETVPVILTNQSGQIDNHRNLDPSKVKNPTYLAQELKSMKSLNAPVKIVFQDGTINYLYYKDSKLFEELKYVIDEMIASFMDEVMANSASVPVIYTDSSQSNVLQYSNLDQARLKSLPYPRMSEKKLSDYLSDMKLQHEPIQISLGDGNVNYIFYQNSFLIQQLKYYPFVQFFIIGLFILVSYLLFSSARKAEQNQVWVGMSKETAHQLGTPISSLMAWLEILKMKFDEEPVLDEIGRDIQRLEIITDRFSKIGSEPELLLQNLKTEVEESINYLQKRISKKVEFSIHSSVDEPLVKLNPPLFGWVIENLSKNAVDAMEGVGKLHFEISQDHHIIHLDISDTGKGIPKNKHSSIFQPGYTTKKRGWGLGLTLVKRIIDNYHNAKIEVKESSPEKGTTFRISLGSKQKRN